MKDAPTSRDDSQSSSTSFAAEFVDFLKNNKKWWLTPIFVVACFLFIAAALLPSAVAPFIYRFK